ncbi:MAG: FG-GAP-like repeat-containing protein [Gemmataceae bacterium]
MTDPSDDAGGDQAGAVYLFNLGSGQLISTLNGTTNERLGDGDIVVLPSSDFLIFDPFWDNGSIHHAGAVVYGNRTTGFSGPISSQNSLVGGTDSSFIGSGGATILPDGNFVILSPRWNDGTTEVQGAVTFGSVLSGLSGTVSAANSLVGSSKRDGDTMSITVLEGGDYLIATPQWDRGSVVDAGAVTLVKSNSSHSGIISPTNSLVGSQTDDRVGANVLKLSNGNVVVSTQYWDNGSTADVGAVTLLNVSTGLVGPVTAANSLIGSSAYDGVGNVIYPLKTGNYIVHAAFWDRGAATDAGALAFCSGQFGTTGPISTANSLIGSHPNDFSASKITLLDNGNYVIANPFFDRSFAVPDVGAVTFGDGQNGTVGEISEANSLLGTNDSDRVGINGVMALAGGVGYVVCTSTWQSSPGITVGAATWGSGTTGIQGTISNANSIVGTQAGDSVGQDGVVLLKNSNYVVISSLWHGKGAVTFGVATGGTAGVVSVSNSLTGSTSGDMFNGVNATVTVTSVGPFGDFIVSLPYWDNGSVVDAGAVVYERANFDVVGPVSPAQALVGSSDQDRIGTVISSASVVGSPHWSNGSLAGAGAVTVMTANGPFGPITAANSLVGTAANDAVGVSITPLSSQHVVVSSLFWDRGNVVDSGAVTWMDVANPIVGPVTDKNSLVGTHDGDGSGLSIKPLSNGNYLVVNPTWDRDALMDAGAITFCNGATGATGIVSESNSLVGSADFDRIGNGEIFERKAEHQLLILSPTWGHDAGAVTFVDSETGLTAEDIPGGPLSNFNGIVGTAPGDHLQANLPTSAIGPVFVFLPRTPGYSVYLLGNLTNVPVSFWDQSDLAITPTLVESGLRLGQPRVYEALHSITVNSPIVVNNPNGPGGMLEFRSYGTIALNASIDTGDADFTIRAFDTDNGTITPAAGAVLTTGNGLLSFESGLFVLNQTLVVNGRLNLSSAVLKSVAILPATVGQTVTIIDNQSAADPASPFQNLPEGATYTQNQVTFTISYVGGTGNDVTLTRISANNPPTISNLPNQSTIVNVPILNIPFTIGDIETPASNLVLSVSTSNPVLLPLSGIVLGGTGADRTISLTTAGGQLGSSTVTVTVTDAGNLSTSSTLTITVTAPHTLVGYRQFSVGEDRGKNILSGFNPDGSLRYSLTPFGSFTGGIRTAAGDFNGDGVADIVVATGPGSATHVKIFDGVTQAELFTIDPFEASFTGGLYVAAGDINGDGKADLAITPDEGGGPRCRVFNGNGFTQIADFFGIDDTNFRGGARASIGDMNGDGKGDLQVVAGFGGGPRVACFDGSQLGSNGGPKLFNDFFAFEQSLRNGIFVASGDVNGDGYADLVAGGGPGGGPRVFILDGKSLVQNGSDTLVSVGNYFAGDISNRGGIRVAVKDLDGDNKADVVTGSGVNAGSHVSAYLGKNTTPLGGTPPIFLDFNAFAGFSGGVFVG